MERWLKRGRPWSTTTDSQTIPPTESLLLLGQQFPIFFPIYSFPKHFYAKPDSFTRREFEHVSDVFEYILFEQEG